MFIKCAPESIQKVIVLIQLLSDPNLTIVNFVMCVLRLFLTICLVFCNVQSYYTILARNPLLLPASYALLEPK